MESDFCCRLCQKDMRVAGVLQHYTKLFQSSTQALSVSEIRTALSSLPQNPAPEPSAPPALIQNTSLRCDWFSCHLPDSGQCFQNFQWSGARLQMQAKHFAVQQLALVFQANATQRVPPKRTKQAALRRETTFLRYN